MVLEESEKPATLCLLESSLPGLEAAMWVF